MIIGVDVDDVVADYINELNAYVKKYHNLHFSKDMYKTYNFNETWKMSPEKFNEIFGPWRLSKEFAAMKTTPHAKEVLTKLAKKNQVIFITSRNIDIESTTRKWLESNFAFPINLIHSYNKFTGKSTQKNKKDICKETNVTVMIEDHDVFAQECANEGIPVILLDNPWNQQTPAHKLITRVNSWLDIEKIIQNLEKRA